MIPPQPGILWQIERGAVRTLTWNSEEIAVALGYWGVGDIVGHPLSLVKPYYIQCLTSVEVKLLPQSLWTEALNPLILHIQQAEELLRLVHLNPLHRANASYF